MLVTIIRMLREDSSDPLITKISVKYERLAKIRPLKGLSRGGEL